MGGPSSRYALFARGAASGVLLGLAFPPVDAWPLAFVGLVPLALDLERLAEHARRGAPGAISRAFAAAFGTGLTLYLSLLWWIVLLDAPALTIPWVRYPGTFAIVSYLALFAGTFGALYVFVRAWTPLPAALAAGSLWTLVELARGYGELGFPWGTLGYAAVPFLPALQIAAVAGISGLTFWIVSVNGLAVSLVRSPGRRGRTLLAIVVVLVVPSALGAMRIARPLGAPAVRVALVQPSVSNAAKWAPDKRAEIFETLAELSRQGVRSGARLVVWPETAAPCYLLKDQEWRPWVEALARELGVPLFVGVPDYQVVAKDGSRRVTYTNTGAYFDASGNLVGRMDKIRLVPFGERMPFSQWVPWLAALDFGEADFLSGEGPVLFELGYAPSGKARFGNLVCFEATYPDLVRSHANAGAEFLVNITNDSWFGAGSGAEQHKRMAVVRCVETGCGMARCANSGISAGVDPFGRTTGETALFEAAVAVVDVPLRRGRTPYARLGDWVGAGASALSIGFVVAGFARRRRFAVR